MSQIFDDSDASDDDKGFKVNNEYAKNYNNWRQKEELNKLKTKYGESALELSDEENSSSSDEDEDGALLTEEFEKDFYATLASLKKKDPKIYDGNIKFFKELPEGSKPKFKKAKDEPMFIKDYERKLLLEKGGNLSDDEDENAKNRKSPTYIEEQKKLIDDLKKGLKNVDEDDDDTFKVRDKTKDELQKEDEDYKQWLLGQKEEIDDQETQTNLKPLKDFWSDPKLDKNEKFLRDYILNKRFLETDDKNYIPSYEEIIHDSDEGLSEDEKEVDRQDEFEHKYNYRFEEPDDEFIKRYPRTMENSVRKKDDKRKVKRAEVKERKQKEKQQKMEDIRKLKELKRKEIEEKIQQLKEITGNTDIDFNDDDIDGDFDPEAHDKRMHNLFNDEFYQGEEGEEKPKFPELDEELEIENWDHYEEEIGDEENNGPHCEDDDFIMDCDYDPNASKDPNETKGKKKRKRKSKFAKVVQEKKPVFDPNDKTYEEYLDEYYKLDCEDIIGDIPCRFKYKKVVPNSFGLSIEEILMAKDRELNRWCSLKKAVQIRPDHVEKYDVIAYNKKASNEGLKQKILSSLYQNEDNSASDPTTSLAKNNKKDSKLNKKEVKNANVNYAEIVEELNKINTEEQKEDGKIIGNSLKKEQKKKKKGGKNKTKRDDQEKNLVDAELNVSLNREVKQVEENEIVKKVNEKKIIDQNKVIEEEKNVQKSKGKKKKSKDTKTESNQNEEVENNKKKGKRKYSETDMSKVTKNKGAKKIKNAKPDGFDISDSRLLAFGIKPKKFKNKLKYGKK
nr:protein KRI1 homolog [Onthophagus taurus]